MLGSQMGASGGGAGAQGEGEEPPGAAGVLGMM